MSTADNDKNVRSMVLNDGMKCAVIGLEDAPRAVEVSLIDGAIALQEGLKPGRIHGWVVTPDAVQEFSVARIGGKTAISFIYKRRGILTSHFVGHVQDIEAAKSWVERVNIIYQERAICRNNISKNRKTGYRDFPIVNDILESGVNIVLPGVYQYSFERNTTEGLTTWEKAYVTRCLDLLADKTGEKRERLTFEVRRPPKHNYKWLSTKVLYQHMDYGARITQPLELIFDHWQRRQEKIGVNPFSIIKQFALVYFENSIFGRIYGTGNRPIEGFRNFLSRFNEAASSEKLLLGTPAGQSVHFAFNDAHLGGYFNTDEHLQDMNDVRSLAYWLCFEEYRGVDVDNNDYQRKAVVCDIGETKILLEEINKIGDSLRMKLTNEPGMLIKAMIPYEEPIPVGYCYRADDAMWPDIEKEGLLDIIDHPSQAVRSDFEAFRKRVKNIGIEIMI